MRRLLLPHKTQSTNLNMCNESHFIFFFFWLCVVRLFMFGKRLFMDRNKERKKKWLTDSVWCVVCTHSHASACVCRREFLFFFFVSTRRITYQHLWQKTIFTCIHADRLQKTKTSSNYYFRSWLLFFFSYIYKFRFRFDRADTWYTHTHRTHRINTKHEVNAQFDRKRNGTAAIEPNRISK